VQPINVLQYDCIYLVSALTMESGNTMKLVPLSKISPNMPKEILVVVDFAFFPLKAILLICLLGMLQKPLEVILTGMVTGLGESRFGLSPPMYKLAVFPKWQIPKMCLELLLSYELLLS
jgi:hypothetical protein